MSVTKEKLKELLVLSGYINETDFESAIKEAEKDNLSLELILVEKGLISDENLGRIIAEGSNYLFINLRQRKIDPVLLKLIPEVVALSQSAIIFEKNLITKLATSNLDNYEFTKLLEKKLQSKIEVYYTTPYQIRETFKYYKSDLGGSVNNLINDLKLNPQNEENIVKLVNILLEYAHDNHASDIHIEPLEIKVIVRFRIDGILHQVIEYPKDLHSKIAFRIKIMSRLRTDEQLAPQDGRFDYKKDTETFDVRVSIIPITNGENVVLRLLSRGAQQLNLEDLGFLADDLNKVKRAFSKPHGTILSVGPTGSGKTTTLYSILRILNTPEVNIMTIEDPVEYEVEGARQIQLNPQKNITFSTGLRSIIRQDPNVIMVGEIRDEETAKLTVNAAMTGHLLFSTMHANDAATAFPRLIEMGIEPFLVASSVNVVIGQRLVRKNCERCLGSYVFNTEEIKLLDPTVVDYLTNVLGKKDLSKTFFFKGYGNIGNNQVCPVCNGVGYQGRIGIFEVIEVTTEIRALIIQKASAEMIDKKAKELGMTPMFYDGLMKAFQGITTLEEIIRVTKT